MSRPEPRPPLHASILQGDPTPHDDVNHPSHYIRGGIEAADVCDAFALDRYDFQVVKYVLRAKFKGNELKDLKKALWYLTRKIELFDRLTRERQQLGTIDPSLETASKEK